MYLMALFCKLSDIKFVKMIDGVGGGERIMLLIGKRTQNIDLF